jgi:periplasmic divalent cation tolerance protein
MSAYLQVQTTTASQEQAEAIAKALVERHLSACVQVVGPIKSCYRWEGELQTSQEWLCLAKTTSLLYAELEDAIRELHTYDVPEIIATPITHGSGGYLAWLTDQLEQHSK